LNRKEKKVAQCRYCVNSSNEGGGIWIDEYLWICYPCIERIRKAERKEPLEKKLERIKVPKEFSKKGAKWFIDKARKTRRIKL